jgi:hypothetical protein
MTIEALGRASSPVVAGLAPPVGLKPSLRRQPRNDFLIQIVGVPQRHGKEFDMSQIRVVQLRE